MVSVLAPTSIPENRLTFLDSDIDCLFVNPRDLVGAFPYVKSAYHAGVLRYSGLKIDFIDPAASNISHAQIIKIIEHKKPKVICISAFPSTLPDAYQTVQSIRLDFPEIIIVLEGYHVNADPGIILHMGAHYGLIGDAEYTLLELCSAVLAGNPVDHKMIGLAVNDNGTLILNEPAVINDINLIPMPVYDLMPIGKYYSASTSKNFMVLFTSRGCPFNCNFCASPLQLNYRYLTTANTIKYIDVLVNKLNVGWIEFMDLTFTISKKRTIELCHAIKAADLKFEWGCETRADLIDEELIVEMKYAGCKKITFGVEAGNEKVRYRTGKKISNEKFLEVFDLCRKHNIKTMANFIIGHPNETRDQILETISFAKKLKPFNVFFTRMTPLPDVDIFKKGVEMGEVDPDIWVKYMKGDVGHPIYCTPSIDPKELERLYNRAFASYYFTLHALKNYLPLFLNIKFLIRSAGIFIRIAFGSPVFK